MNELTIRLETKSQLPLYEQIYIYIKNDIQSGKIKYGDKLPSTRALAKYLDVSRNIKGLVETSLNLGIAKTEEKQVTAVYRVRSAVQSKKTNMKKVLAMWAEYLGGTSSVEGEYPAWAYKTDSKIRPIVVDTYKELFGKEPIVTTIHAGLECGLFAGKLEGLDCVSIGPEMLSIHSPNEKLSVASTQRTWELLKGILKNCK